MTGPRTAADYALVLRRGDVDEELVGPLAWFLSLRHTDPGLYDELAAYILAD